VNVTRPRSIAAHQKVMRAAMELVAERGVDATSMDAIADASGVSKATIYKHWADKEALILEMMADINGLHSRPKFDSGNTREDMTAVLAYRPPENAEMRERIMPHFIAYSARHPEFGRAWRNWVMDTPRKELEHLLQQGIAKNELAKDIDIEVALALLLGPIMYWYVFLRKSVDEPSRRLAEGVIESFWRAWGLVEALRKPVTGLGRSKKKI
jgi:AcrR family transcriptional regulator